MQCKRMPAIAAEAFKLQRRRPPPRYADRVYDSAAATPTPLERRLFGPLAGSRGPAVREAARLVAWYRCVVEWQWLPARKHGMPVVQLSNMHMHADGLLGRRLAAAVAAAP